jgi:hypothetical protein
VVNALDFKCGTSVAEVGIVIGMTTGAPELPSSIFEGPKSFFGSLSKFLFSSLSHKIFMIWLIDFRNAFNTVKMPYYYLLAGLSSPSSILNFSHDQLIQVMATPLDISVSDIRARFFSVTIK